MNQPCIPRPAIAVSSCRLHAGKCCSAIFILLTLLFTVSVAQADPDDDYLNIYSIITHANQQAANGNATLAHTNYLIAQTDLLIFQQANPTWQPRIMAYRLKYLADKIAGTPEPMLLSETNAPMAVHTPAAPAAKSAVKLLDPGSEPRTMLRLHPAVGDKLNLTLTMKMTMNMAAAGQAIPAINIPTMLMTLSGEVKGIAANGDIAYDLTFDDATVADDPNAQAMVVTAMKSSLASIKGMTASGRMSEQGIIKGMQMKLPASADPQLKQTMDQMKESFSSSSIPLPDEAVGPGAKWEYTTKVKSQGMTIDQKANYQLMAVDGDRITLHTTFTQHAAHQKIQNPAMPGIVVDLQKMNGTGAGDSIMDLGHVMPQSANLAETVEMVMGMNLGQKQQTMDMNMTMNIAIQAK